MAATVKLRKLDRLDALAARLGEAEGRAVSRREAVDYAIEVATGVGLPLGKAITGLGPRKLVDIVGSPRPGPKPGGGA